MLNILNIKIRARGQRGIEPCKHAWGGVEHGGDNEQPFASPSHDCFVQELLRQQISTLNSMADKVQSIALPLPAPTEP